MENKQVQPWQQYQALYLHIPFCVQKCLYCDFASYAGFDEQAKREYTDAVCKEIALRADEAANMAANASIYFGGGTPSVLTTECIAKLVNALKLYGFWQQPCEATIEVNPGTADLAKLQTLRQLGFDRISFGVQSLQDNELQAIGRIHNAQQALEALTLARKAGFARVSADLIYGLPSQTLASLQDTLERLTDTGIEHISVYGLIVEDGTPLASLVDKGRITLPDDDTAADMYELVQSFLRERDFERYEISNYAKNGQYSRRSAGKRLPDQRAGKQFPFRPALIAAVDQQQRAAVALRADQPPRRLNHPNHARQGHAEKIPVRTAFVVIALHRAHPHVRLGQARRNDDYVFQPLAGQIDALRERAA